MTTFWSGVVAGVVAGVVGAVVLGALRSSMTLPFTRSRTIVITPPLEMPPGDRFKYRLLRVCAGGGDGQAIRVRAIRTFKIDKKSQHEPRVKLQVKLQATMQDGLQFKCFVDVSDAEIEAQRLKDQRPCLERYQDWMKDPGCRWEGPSFDRDLKDKRVWFFLPDYGRRTRYGSENNFLQPAMS